MRSIQLLTRLVFGLAFVILVQSAWAVVTATNKAYLVEIDGAIGPVSQELIMRGIDNAEDEAATMVILQMNTPGGLDHSMREIIQGILDAHVPVITYISPQGSRAASAGTYILYASHVAAMAPATNLGSATPVQVGGVPATPTDPGSAGTVWQVSQAAVVTTWVGPWPVAMTLFAPIMAVISARLRTINHHG